MKTNLTPSELEFQKRSKSKSKRPDIEQFGSDVVLEAGVTKFKT
jgi:hypothetical protein